MTKAAECSDEDWRLVKNDVRRLLRRLKKHNMKGRVRITDDVAIYTYAYDPKRDRATQKGIPKKARKK